MTWIAVPKDFFDAPPKGAEFNPNLVRLVMTLAAGSILVSENGVRYVVDSFDGEWVTFHREGKRKAERWTRRIERVAERLRPAE